MSPPATLGTPATIATMAKTAEDIERRLAAGEWLLPGEVAILLGADRSTVVRMLTSGRLRHRYRSGSGRYRECDPEQVRALLAERRRVHGDQQP